MIDISRTAKALILALGKMLGVFSFLITSALLSRYMSKEDYGTFRQCWMMYLILAPVLSAGLGYSLFYYIPKIDKQLRLKFIIRTIAFVLLLGIVSSTIIILSSGKISEILSNKDSNDVFNVFSVFIVFSLPFLLVDGVFMSSSMTSRAFLYSILGKTVILVGLVAPVVLYEIELGSAVVILVGLQVFITFILIMQIIYDFKMKSTKKLSIGISMGKQVRYSLPLAGAGIFGTIFYQIDKMVISINLDPKDFAVYSNGAMENPIVAIISGAVGAVIATELVNLNDQDSLTEYKTLWKNSVRKTAIIILPITCFMFVKSKQIIVLLYTDKYIESAEIFEIYTFLSPIRMVSFATLFLSLNKNIVYLYAHLIAGLLNSILCYFLIKKMGSTGAAYSIVITSYIVCFGLIKYIAICLKSKMTELIPVKDFAIILLLSIVVIKAVSFIGDKMYNLKEYQELSLEMIVSGVIMMSLFVKFKVVKLEEWPIAKRFV